MKFSHKIVAFGLMVFITNCVSLTVNVYFPTAEIQEAAEEIEERVRTGQGAEGLQSSTGSAASNSPLHFSLRFGVREAYAQDVDINIETSSIKKIISTRTKRYKEIEPYMDKGILGEGLKALLILREPGGLDLKTLTQIKKLVQAENNDRQALYKEILTANNLESNKTNMERVEALFYQAIVKKMKPGHFYQVDKDKWEVKKKEK